MNSKDTLSLRNVLFSVKYLYCPIAIIMHWTFMILNFNQSALWIFIYKISNDQSVDTFR